MRCVRVVLPASRGRQSDLKPSDLKLSNGTEPDGGRSCGESVGRVAHAVRDRKALISSASRDSLTPWDAATVVNVSRVGTN